MFGVSSRDSRVFQLEPVLSKDGVQAVKITSRQRLVTTGSQRKDQAMATYRKRRTLWQAQIRRQGQQPISKSFKTRADAESWARAIEAQIDRAALPSNYAQLRTIRLEQLISRYLEEISPKKEESLQGAMPTATA